MWSKTSEVIKFWKNGQASFRLDMENEMEMNI